MSHIRVNSDLGAPAEFADKMKGSRHGVTLSKQGDKWDLYWRVEECPEMTSVESFIEGQDNEANSPMFGGKAVVTFQLTGDNKCLTKIKSETLGEFEVEERYTEEGAHYSTKCGSSSFKEFWPRKVKTEGWFRMVREENLKNYMKAQGMNMPISGYWVHMEECENGVTFTEIVNGFKNVYHTKYDEEQDYEFRVSEGGDCYKRRILTTKLSPTKTLFMSTAPDGRKEEWTHEFCSKGLKMSGIDKTSGESAKLIFEPGVNFSGTYKNVVIVGMEEFGMAAGMPADMIPNMINEFDARLVIGEKDGFITCKYNSKYWPMDFTFKYGEEFTMTFPGLPGSYKVIETREGDKYTTIMKGPKFTTRAVGKITDNFLIQDTVILGTNIKTHQIMQRVYE